MSERLVKVTLNLTEQDLDNVNAIVERTNVAHRTHAVVTALAFTRFITDKFKNSPHAELLFSTGEGFFRVVMPELSPLPEQREDLTLLGKVRFFFARFLTWWK